MNIDYALDMVGFEHNPRTMYAGADLPFYALKNYHGVGVQFMNDRDRFVHPSEVGFAICFQETAFQGYAQCWYSSWFSK